MARPSVIDAEAILLSAESTMAGTLPHLEQALAEILRENDDGSDSSHGVHHARRVLLNAVEIARRESETADLRVLTAAAYLHDLVNPPKNSPQRSQASHLSAEAAGPLLTKLLGLAETMQTEAGKELAEERTEALRQFLDTLAAEIGAENPW